MEERVEIESNPVEEEDVILTAKEAAELIHVKPERLYVLATDGRVPAVKIANEWRFSRNELTCLFREHPEVIFGRRTVERYVSATSREKRRAAMLRLNAMQDRHEAGKRGQLGLMAKLAKQAGLDPDDLSEKNQRSMDLLYQAHMADVRARRMARSQHVTTQERVAALTKNSGSESGPICYQCWRQLWGRPPKNVPNQLCETHQQDLDAFAERLRGE